MAHTSLPPNKFSSLLKEAVQLAGPEAVEAFFETNFLVPLDIELETNENIPAESVRQKRKQTQKIKTFLLTLGKN